MAIVIRQRQPQAAHKRGILCWSVSLLSALIFLLVVSTSASHIHKNAVALHDCVVCTVVADKLADVPVAPALVHDVQLQPYHVVAATVHAGFFPTVQLLPLSRGPPRSPV